jgi:hypothetical protein
MPPRQTAASLWNAFIRLEPGDPAPVVRTDNSLISSGHAGNVER